MAFVKPNLVTFATCVFVIASLVAMVTCQSSGCVFNGKSYRVGQTYMPRPCDICTCSTTGPRCATNNCFYYVMCADGYKDTTKCCMVCPTGDNCRAPDGHIIKRGDTYQLSGKTCLCKEENFGLYGGQAVCQ